jgi:hypothetical protein
LEEYFVTPEVWRTVFEPYGVRCRPVTNTKGADLKTVVQLVVDEQVGVETEGLPFEECRRCHRVKYQYEGIARGRFPALIDVPSKQIVKTKAYFGSGGSADQFVLTSQRVARAMSAAKMRGAVLKPVQEERSR